MKTREEAHDLLKKYTETDSLRKHAYAVEAALSHYAKQLGEDDTLWSVTGLLHDFDYEKYPTAEPGGHPYVGCQILRDEGYPEEMIEAIMGHAHYTGVPRTTTLAKYLFACDELSGLVTASVLVRPDKSIHQLEVSSVKKKLKDKAFARGVNREDVRMGAEEIQLDLDTHIGNVIAALRARSDLLGLSGV
ncbi:MAG: HDIG domain-containing protein [Deltaproteobacteria bacterium]|nr:HDIG domain-containing protein [Deltaproteobacteria bacterium]